MVQESFVPHSSKGFGSSFNSRAAASGASPAKEMAHSMSNAGGEHGGAAYWVRKLDDIFLRHGLAPTIAFKSADMNHNNIVTMDELRQAIKNLVPDEDLSLADLKNVCKAIDVNGNGVIEEEEFIKVFADARKQNVTVIEGEQQRTKVKIIEKPDTEESLDVQSMTRRLEAKMNVKKFFGKLLITEEGNVIIASITRAFKTFADTKDGQPLKPSEYMAICKSLDREGKGFAFAVDVTRFLNKFAVMTNQTDFIWDLKFICHEIEFKHRLRSATTFFLQNTKIRERERILQIDLIGVLKDHFSTASPVAQLLYKSLEGKKGRDADIMLEDLAAAIDDLRVHKNKEQMGSKKPTMVDTKAVLTFKLGLNLQRLMVLDKSLQTNLGFKSLKDGTIDFSTFFKVYVEQNEFITHEEARTIFKFICNTFPHPSKKDIFTLENLKNILGQYLEDFQNDCMDEIIGIMAAGGRG